MATVRLVTEIPPELLEAIEAEVDAGRAPSVSAFVRRAIEKSFENEALWREVVQDALDTSGGQLTDDERAWVDAALQKSMRAG